jgi:mRNA-degrading endonuclease RelE of RelBE toxin-antitoxin system
LKTKISASNQVERWLRGLPPESKSRVRSALRNLAEGSGDIKSLERELEGYCRLRVGPYRIVFRHDTSRLIRLLYADSRDLVYERFLSLLRG